MSRNAVAGQMSMAVVLCIVTPMYFFTMFYRLAPSVLAGDISLSLGLDLSELAYVSGITWISYGLMQLPSGLLVDIFGGRRCLFWICILAAIGNFLFAVSPGPGVAMAGRFVLGLGCAALCPCCAVMANLLPAGSYGRANSLFLAFGLAGSIFAGAPLVLLSSWFGWRAVIVGCGLISLLCAWISWQFIPEMGKSGLDNSSMWSRLKWSFASMLKNAVIVLGNGAIWPYCMWMMLMVGSYFTITALWWAPYLQEVAGLDGRAAGDIISVVCLVMLPVQPLVIAVSERCGSRVGVVRVCTLVSLAAAIILACMGASLGTFAMVISWCAFLLATAYVSSLIYTSIRDMFPASLVGTATGCVQTFPYVIGVPVMQWAYGSMVEYKLSAGAAPGMAYADAMWLIVAFIGGGLVAAIFMKESASTSENTALACGCGAGGKIKE